MLRAGKMPDISWQADPRTFGLSASRPCSYPPARKSCPPPHRPLRKLFPRTVHIHCLGLEIVPGRRRVPLPSVLELPYETDQFMLDARQWMERTRSSRRKDLHGLDQYQNGW